MQKMNITEQLEEDRIVVSIQGELDGSNVNEAEAALRAAAEKASSLIIDLKNLSYVSSAGLRVFLILRRITEAAGHHMLLTNVTEDVMEIFEVTGFVNLLQIEN